MTQDAKTISDALRAPFPDSVIEVKPGSKNRYIGHEVIRERVIDATDNRFDWHLASMEYRNDGAIKVRSNGEVPLVCVATGTLTIPGLGSRTGIGVQVIEFGGGEDSGYKGAETDAFKRAAMAFGCGLQLYSDSPAPQRSTQQHASAQPSVQMQQMSHDEFREACIGGFVNNDSTKLKQLIAQAGDDPERWVLMVKSAQTVAQIGWVATAMEKQGVGLTDAYKEAAIARRKELG